MRLSRLSCIVHLFFLVVVAQESFAIPSYERTNLPLPTNPDEQDKAMIQEVIKLEVYKDSEDPDQYYFVPPFHVRQYQRGAAGMMLHKHNIVNFAAAKKEMVERSKYSLAFSLQKIVEIQSEIKESEEKILSAAEKLAEALEKGNKDVIALRQEILGMLAAGKEKSEEKLNNAQETMRNGGTLLFPGLGRGYFERALVHLASMGASMEHTASEDPDTLSTALNGKLHELSGSYGGFLSVNVYAGFTRVRLEALTSYRMKYFPNLKVSLLPIEKLEFFSLTEFQKDSENTNTISKLLSQVKGSGDYLGAAVVIDTTIAGSEGLAKHLAPFVLPVGIKASFKQKLLPAEAELKCDFSNGFQVRGDAHVRDGLVVYDNDIINRINTNDHNQGACNIKHISGDPKSAHWAALQALEQKYEDLKFKRTELSKTEKDAYYKGVLEDINSNRRTEDSRLVSIVKALNPLGWMDVVAQGLTLASDFHWHTNVQNVENLSSVKFTKKISIQGHQTAEHFFAPNFCLIYNTVLRAYDRCIEVDEDEAKTMSQAVTDASSTCEDDEDPFECGDQRDLKEDSLRHGVVPVPKDNKLTTQL